MNAPTHGLFDTLTSLVTGLGVFGRDKGISSTYVYAPMDKAQLEMAYRGDWANRKAIDIPPFDATRMWRAWQADKEQIGKIEETEHKFMVQQKVQQALVKARLYGGSAILIGTNDGDMSKPLDEAALNRLGEGCLLYLHVLSRWAIAAGPRINDITNPWYLEPEYYTRSNVISSSKIDPQIYIHPSRVAKFSGLDHPDPENAMETWGDSVLQVIDDSIRALSTVSGSVANMIAEAKIDIYRIPKLNELLSTEAGTKKVLERFINANTSKSVINALLMDIGEEVERKQIHFQGIPDVLQMYLLLVCGAADIPATRFLGQSPVGMNATGESDTRNYYDRLKSDQTLRTTPAMSVLDEVLIRHTFGKRDKAIHYNWNSLWQLSDKEKAEIAKLKGEVVTFDVNTGLVPESALAKGRQNQLIEDGTYPGLEQAIQDSEAAGEFSPHDPAAQIEKEQETEAQQQELRQSTLPANPPNNVLPFKKADWLQDATPRPLYVHRDLINADEFTAWAEGQGFKDVLTDLHVTILYSKEPVDPIKLGNDNWVNAEVQGRFDDPAAGSLTIAPGGPRAVERLGMEGAVVLLFASTRLQWRHEDMVYKGASHDYDEYTPHVTITYNSAGVDVERVVPYRGKLVFGPEIFEDITTRPFDSMIGDELQRLPAGSPGGGQFAPGAAAGSASGSIGPGSIGSVRSAFQNFAKSDAVKSVVNKLSDTHTIQNGVSFALQSLLSHATGLDQSTWKLNEDLIEHSVHHLADIAAITRVQAKDYMQKAVSGLIKVRQKAKDSVQDADDPVLEFLLALQEALEKVYVEEPKNSDPRT